MTNPDAARVYLVSEVEELEAFDFVLVAPVDRPLEVTEVTRTEAGELEVRMPGRPPVVPQFDAATRRSLADLDFVSEDPADPLKPWVKGVESAEAAVALLQRVHTQVFGEKPDVNLNLMHGSHRLEHEAEEKLAHVRTRIETIVEGILGRRAEQDDDGDYILPIGQVHVTVAPRTLLDGQIVVRVFTITNVGVEVTAELGLFLARLNFGMMFGRFALDTEHRSIWFDETLLGQEFRDEELRFVVNMVASTADSWDDRLKQMFRGVTYQEVVAGRSSEELPPIKPGEGVGMYL